MRFLLLIMFLFVLCSCCKDENCNSTELPDCIRQMIDVVGDAPPLISVKMQKVDGECRYWLNTDAILKLAQYIVNSNVTLFAIMVEIIQRDCLDDYNVINGKQYGKLNNLKKSFHEKILFIFFSLVILSCSKQDDCNTENCLIASRRLLIFLQHNHS
ncbi:MAG: hypothetical protein IPH57_02605 [Saprospiraceae bacterium]|nr:hypothetical protein [Saprospiraceae bacterium]